MVTYQTNTLIKKPLKEVYDAISDYTKTPLWLGGLEKLEPISGTPGKSGFKSKYTFKENGRTVIFREEVKEVRPYQSFSYSMESDNVILEGHTQLREENGGTKLVVSSKAKGKTLGMKLMMPLLKGMMRKRQKADFDRFKSLMEGGMPLEQAQKIKGGAIPWVDEE